MNTLESTHFETDKTVTVLDKLGELVKRFDETAEFNRYAIITVGFLVVGTLGGATVALFAWGVLWKMALIVAASMLSLTLMLAVAPMRWITRALAATILIDLLMMLL
ncbi:MAG: hypothetical protein Kow0075_09170 [Salibacteraceae bacterium]